MKGQQTLELSHASITEAISEYLGRHLVHPVTVLEVSATISRNGYGAETFTVEVKFEQPERPIPVPVLCTYTDDYGDRCQLYLGHPGPHECPPKKEVGM